MCFSSKVKTPKVSSELPAPEPVLLEDPKGVEYGDGSNTSTDNVAEVKLDDKVSSTTGSALGTTKTIAKNTSTDYTTSAVRKSLAKKLS